METDQLLLEIARLVLSWPVIIGVLAFGAARKFDVEIRQLFTKFTVVKWGSFEASQPQLASQPSEPPKVEIDVSTPAPDSAGINHWRFKYLNLFLVPNSKFSLLWISQNDRVPVLTYFTEYTLMQSRPNNTAEKLAILNALHSEGLITRSETTVQATDLGKRFLEFVGLTK